MRNFTVLLRDYTNPEFKERVTLTVQDGQKVTDAAKVFMTGYCEGNEKPYIENHEKNERHIRCVFAPKSDFFLMWGIKSKI